MRLLLIGPPGAGKGTYCKKLAIRYNLEHLSSGDIFRREIAAGSELGIEAKKHIDDGKLVPDEIVIQMMSVALEEAKNCVLDGFPRTLNQAQGLDSQLEGTDHQIDAVIELMLADEVAASRLELRRVCPECGAVYHLAYIKPKADGICDVCGTQLMHRDDDKKEVIAHRLEVYHRQTEPIIEYYRVSGKPLLHIDADAAADLVLEMIVRGIDCI